MRAGMGCAAAPDELFVDDGSGCVPTGVSAAAARFALVCFAHEATSGLATAYANGQVHAVVAPLVPFDVTTLSVGSDSDARFTGIIDELSIWSRALTTPEMNQLLAGCRVR
jgi:hypothetical protein